VHFEISPASQWAIWLLFGAAPETVFKCGREAKRENKLFSGEIMNS